MSKKPSTTTTRTRKNEDISDIITGFNNSLLSTLKFDIKHKNETQKKLTQSIKKNDVTVCVGPAGTGKAQPLDSDILTPNGWVKMGDICIGDEVFGVDGSPIKVIGVYPQGEKDIYEITFSDGTTAESCKEHLWFTQTYEDRNYKKRVRLNDGSRVRIGDKGRDGSVKSLDEIINSLTVGKLSPKANHSIPITKEIKFTYKDVLIDPYTLGVLLGDGGLTTSSVMLSSDDEQLINETDKRLPKKHIVNKISRQTFSIKSIGVKDNSISLALKEYSLNGLKSEDKFIPNEYLFNTKNIRLETLQGLLDTDGIVDKRSGQPIFYSTSINLINGVKFIVQSLGGIVNLTHKTGKYKLPDGTIKTCKECFILTINLPEDIQPFKLTRKLNLLKKRTKYKPARFIKSVKYIGKKEAQCIMVDDEKHLYLTNDCIVTHNTLLSVFEGLMLLKNFPNIYKEIKLVKSITQLKNEELGTLPGDEKDKLKYHMMSFLDAFHDLIGEPNTNKLIEAGLIKFEVFGTYRGRSLKNAIIIVDEFQNISHDNAKTFLTRFSDNTKVIVLGDTGQIDLKNKKESSLERLVQKMRAIPEEGVEVIEFSEKDIVRHRLTSYFIKLFTEPEQPKVKEQPKVFEVKELTFFEKILNFFR
jgi:phosphate starvation-inducible protein PhoH